MKKTAKPTRYPGVLWVGERSYRIRAKVLNPRTGRFREIDRVLHDVTAPEAARVRAGMIAEFKKGELRRGGPRLRVEDYARTWLDSKKATTDKSTAARYKEAIESHVLPVLGDYYCDTLMASDVQAWVNESLKRKNPRTKKLYRPETVLSWYRILRTMIRDAMAQLDLARDPTLRISLPEPGEREDDNALSPEELNAFLEVMRQHHPQHYALTATLAFTGLRFCHASALQWDDVDEEAAVIRVRRKQVRRHVAPVSRHKRAPREIPLAPELAVILREHRQRLLGKQAKGIETGWVFPSRAGTLRTPSGVMKAWQACLDAIGLGRRFTPHGLRRTFNDLARRAGVDAVVTRALTGHVTERMRERYSTVALEEKRAAVAGVLRLIHPPRGGDPGGDGAGRGSNGTSHR